MFYSVGVNTPHVSSLVRPAKKKFNPESAQNSVDSNMLTRTSGPSLNKNAAQHGKRDSVQFSGHSFIKKKAGRLLRALFPDRLPNAMIAAASEGELKFVQDVLEICGVDPDFQDEDNDTALIMAASRGFREITQILLDKNANPDLQDNKGNTALICAAIDGHPEITRMLLGKNAKPDLQNQEGNTALICAAINGHPEIARMLLDKNANPDLATTKGNTALIFSAAKGHPEIVRMLLDKNANPCLKNSEGKTARMLAEEKGNTHIAEILTCAEAEWEARQNANWDLKDNDGNTLLIRAVSRAPDIVGALLDKNVNPNLKNNNGDTPLILAASNGHPEIVQMLLGKNANPDLQNKCGRTALIFSAAKGHPEIVRMLLDNNANPVLANQYGNTARMLAEENGHTQIADMLARAEAEWEARHGSRVEEGSPSASRPEASSSSRMSPTRAVSPVKSPSREEASPTDIVMKHYKKQKPLTEYPGDYQKLLDQTVVDYMALRLKDDLEGEESAQLKAKVRLGSQYSKDAPEAVRAFWDAVCQQATNQTVPELLGTSQKGLACIAGMEDLKKKIKTSFVNPYLWHSNPERFRRPDGTLPNIKLNNPDKGLLLYGLEGNGKSYLAKKLAEEMDRPYITLKPSDIGSKYHGESEKAAREAFKKAAEKSPSFLIIDEIDSFLSKKEGMQHSDVKIINELMTQLEEAPQKGITVIGTTNHVDKLEKAAVRDGRFSVQLEVPPPGKTSRLAMWNMFLQEATADGSLPFTDPEREKLAQLTRGCSTARIKNLVEQAAERSIEEFKDLDLDIIKDLIQEKGPSYDAERMAPYEHID